MTRKEPAAPIAATYEKLIKAIAKYQTELVQYLDERPTITDVNEAIKMQAQVREHLDLVASTLKAPLEKLHSWLQMQVTPELLSAADVTTMTVANVGRVVLKDDLSVSQQDKEALYTWLDDNGFPDLITRVVQSQTLTAFCRRRFKAGEEMPAGVKVTPYSLAVITRATGKK